MTTQHTPTPWYFDEKSAHPWKVLCDTKGFEGVPEVRGTVCEVGYKPNAPFIVRAVNSHDALVKALETARAYLNVSLGSPTWDGPNPYPIIDDALALARGDVS